MRATLQPHGLTHVQFVLLASLWWLSEHDARSPTQARLAEQAGTDQMMTSQVLRKLEHRGLLERPADPQDTRARRLRLTPAGQALLARALNDVETADEQYFAPLGRRRAQFARSLAALDAAHTARGRSNPSKQRRQHDEPTPGAHVAQEDGVQQRSRPA